MFVMHNALTWPVWGSLFLLLFQIHAAAFFGGSHKLGFTPPKTAETSDQASKVLGMFRVYLNSILPI